MHHYQQSLEVKEQVLGEEHTNCLNTLDSIGLVLAEMGKFEEARESFQRSLEIKGKLLGK